MSTVVALMGFAGALTLSAIKRDRGVKDYSLESAICKVYGSEMLWRVVNESLQIAAGIERLAVVDRNVLRLALAELEEGAVPTKVVIDEAIRLARWFGSSRSPAFVNGILDRVARERGRL